MSIDAGWYRPVCDQLLTRLIQWYKKYDMGKEAADCPQVSMTGQIVKVITKRAHKVAFRPTELDHLLRLMTASNVNSTLIEDFTRVRDGLQHGALRTGGFRVVELVFYRQDLEEIIHGLLRIKTGKLSIEEVAEQQKEAGKDLFEA
jgi:hypothetical protein